MSKYHSKKTERVLPSGKRIMFDSQKEAERFDQLMLWQKAGGIRKLKLQPEITLQEAFTTVDGIVNYVKEHSVLHDGDDIAVHNY